jgi:hypothetical protein
MNSPIPPTTSIALRTGMSGMALLGVITEIMRIIRIDGMMGFGKRCCITANSIKQYVRQRRSVYLNAVCYSC